MSQERKVLVGTEYKVITDWFCMSAGSKARKIENHLNSMSAEGWEYAALESVTVLGFDVGFYLVLKRPPQSSAQ